MAQIFFSLFYHVVNQSLSDWQLEIDPSKNNVSKFSSM